jgi:hypothetical protein
MRTSDHPRARVARRFARLLTLMIGLLLSSGVRVGAAEASAVGDRAAASSSTALLTGAYASTLGGSLVTVSGVLRMADGRPVPGAPLYLSGLNGSSSTLTSSDGSFSLQAPPGEDALQVISRGSPWTPPAELHLPREFTWSTRINVQQNTELSPTLPQPVMISATIQDTRGEPIEGATTNASGDGEEGPNSWQSEATPASSDGEGHATLYILPSPKATVDTSIESAGGVKRHSSNENVNATTNTQLTLTLPATPTPPKKLAAVGEAESAVLTWQPPASPGGAPVTGYEVSASQIATVPNIAHSKRRAMQVGPKQREARIAGLEHGAEYEVTVAARNRYGPGRPAVTRVRVGFGPVPQITKIAPKKGPVQGGTAVTITGTHLQNVSEVTFGGVAAAQVQERSATSLRAVSPPGTVGIAPVVVTTAAGASPPSKKARFTYASH